MAICIKELNFIKDQKLLITLMDNRVLEGSYNQKSERRSSIVLHKVSYVPFNGKRFEQLEFKLNDIKQIDLVGGEKTEETSIDSLNLSSPGDAIEIEEEPLYKKIKECVSNLLLIDTIDENFFEAVDDLQSAHCVAVVGEGSHRGRFNLLSLLGVATHRSIYLFDIINLGSRAFRASNCALKKLLQSDQYLKVVHNCRFLSDCLKHKYNVELKNVFDTQACHFVISKYNSRPPPSSISLPELVSEYLKLPSSVFGNQVFEPEVWCRRPLQDGMTEIVAWKVGLLRKLKPPMDDAFHAPFDNLCQFYLSSIRDQDDDYTIQAEINRGEEQLPKEISEKRNP